MFGTGIPNLTPDRKPQVEPSDCPPPRSSCVCRTLARDDHMTDGTAYLKEIKSKLQKNQRQWKRGDKVLKVYEV